MMKKYKPGERVSTPFGHGVVKVVDENLSYPYLIMIDKLPNSRTNINSYQGENGGLLFCYEEISPLKDSNDKEGEKIMIKWLGGIL